jgi:hypothetical protein
VVPPLSEVGESLKSVCASKSEGMRELKSLECSINYEGSNCGKGNWWGVGLVLWVMFVCFGLLCGFWVFFFLFLGVLMYTFGLLRGVLRFFFIKHFDYL